MDRLHGEEIFATPEVSKEFLDSLSFEEFTKWTDMLNGMAREIPAPQRGMKGTGHITETSFLHGSGVAYRPPADSDRVPLMKEAFERSKKVSDSEKAGLLLAFTVNAVHPYDDGNGRTSRMLYSLLAHGYDGSLGDKEYFTSLLENTKGREVVDLNPSRQHIDYVLANRMAKAAAAEKGLEEPLPTYVFDGYNGAFVNEQSPDQLTVGPNISSEAREKLHFVMMDGYFTIATFLKVLPVGQIRQFIKSFENGKRIALDGDSLLAGLTEDQIDQLYETAIKNKREYIEHIINLGDDELTQLAELYRPE